MRINSRFTKVAVATGLVVATGAGVLGLTGFASAQMADNPAVVVSREATTTADSRGTLEAAGSASPSDVDVNAQSTNPGTETRRPSPIAGAANALGMTEAELRAELLADKSIADVAREKNIDLNEVIAALTATFKAHLDEEVASGEHTQAEADAKLAQFTTRLDDMVNGVRPSGGRGGHGPEGRGPGRGDHSRSEGMPS